jgi:V8-like Glu-specific endopeptidase
VLGSDVRQCRINAGCTAWLFSQFAVGTAGHCMSSGTAGKILHFNVPLSSSTGGATPAHPNDQYAIESFLQFLNAGVGLFVL